MPPPNKPNPQKQTPHEWWVAYHEAEGYAKLRWRNKIWQHNLGLVDKACDCEKLGLKPSQLEQAKNDGYLGLLKAVEGYSLQRRCAFSSFAVPYIRGAVLQFVRDHAPIKIDRKMYELASRAFNVQRRLTQQNGATTIEEIANACRASVPELKEAIAAFKFSSPCSMPRDKETGEEIEFPDTSEGIVAREETLKEMAIAAATQHEKQIREAAYLLQKLSLPDNQKQWAFDYFFGGKDESAIARAYRISPEKVSECIKSVLEYFADANCSSRRGSNRTTTAIRLQPIVGDKAAVRDGADRFDQGIDSGSGTENIRDWAAVATG
jgi:RNA polymerase sigma-B factor